MLLLYAAACGFLLLAAVSHRRASAFIGAQPMPGTGVHTLFVLFGTAIPNIALIGLFIGGFFWFSWWIPLAVMLGAMVFVNVVYNALPLGATWVLVSFPVGAAATIALLATV